MTDGRSIRSRRRFVKLAALGALSAGFALRAAATSPPARLEESDPVAQNLGYRHDATQVDAKKFNRYQAGQACANCQLYQAKPTDPWGACAIYGARLVNGKGWCNAYVKKA